ncbi:MAG: glycosyltransferase family 2 protein [Deltaproteobacteria bacterium]|nr:glycosyltransferase family 2 protein [Deltaproteobacteria bacterium]
MTTAVATRDGEAAAMGVAIRSAIPAALRGAVPAAATGAGAAIPDRVARTVERVAILAGAGLLLLLVVSLEDGATKLSVAREALGGYWGVIAWPAAAMGAVVTASVAWRLVLWATYRPVPALDASDPRLPAVTVLVPAYNEGACAGECVRSILASDYPADRLRVVAVDDGSRDDTLAHIRAAAASDGAGRALVVSLPRNGGKRGALHAAFARADTPVVVTVDSDTILPRDAIRALVTPIVLDPGVGGVAGRIEVLNRDANVLTRMLGVRYRIGFDFVRASQSRIRSVFVCPGALTAWRMDALRGGIDAWRDQRFLGATCHNGDDHALTNLALSRGYATIYQGNAVARTKVPEGYRGLSLMYLRWARSNVRESLRWMAMVPRLARRARNWPAIADGLATFVQIPLRLYLLLFGYGLLLVHPSLFLRSVAAALVFSVVHVAVYLRSERSLDAAYTVLYAVFSLLTLQWVYPWAAVTVRRARWLTR